MRERVGSDHMVCPKCGMEQAVAKECGFCGVVVDRYRKNRVRLEATPLVTGGVLFALLLLGVSGWMFYTAWTRNIEPERPTAVAHERAPDVVTPADPSELGNDWFTGAFGFRQAVSAQIEVKEPMVVYVRPRECDACATLQRDILNADAFRKWIGSGLKVKVVADLSPDETELVGKLGLTDLPGAVVIRGDGKRSVVPLTKDGQPVTVDAFVASCKAAAGR